MMNALFIKEDQIFVVGYGTLDILDNNHNQDILSLKYYNNQGQDHDDYYYCNCGSCNRCEEKNEEIEKLKSRFIKEKNINKFFFWSMKDHKREQKDLNSFYSFIF